MKKASLICMIIMGMLISSYGQDINGSSPVVLPLPGQTTYTVSSGQSINISSSQSVTLNPGVTIEQGAVVSVGLVTVPNYPVPPSNPANDYSINWILTKLFDENGSEIGASKAFFDNNGKSTQTQTKNESNGYVLVKQTLYDFYQRQAITTLAAPANNSAFAYQSNFMTNNGIPYSYYNFNGDPDNAQTQYSLLNNSDPVDSKTEGTLGWYYSNNNTLEPYVAATQYPYSSKDYTRDGTGTTNRVTDVGDYLQMGSTHETTSSSFPVINELNNYLAIRNQFFSKIAGATPLSISGNAVETVSADQDGVQVAVIKDIAGKVLMTGTADPNGYLSINNTSTLAAAVAPGFEFTVNNYYGSPTYQGIGDVAIFSVSCDNPITVYCNHCLNNLLYQGPASGFNLLGVSLNQAFKITSSSPFSVTGSNLSGYVEYDHSEASISEPTGSTIQYFRLTNSSPITITSDFSDNYQLYDMVNNVDVTSTFTSGNILPAGYYKLSSIVGPTGDSGPVTISYTNIFSNVSYNYYNQLGQLIASITPNGVQLLQGDLSSYSDYTKLPFVTTYGYDLQGRRISATSPDGGTTNYIYRQDGKIRFSQNADQRSAGTTGPGNSGSPYAEKFSYVNYDQWGRMIEGGEYAVTKPQFSTLSTYTAVLEATDPTGGLPLIDPSGIKLNTINTYYDTPDPGLAIATNNNNNYVQDPGFLKGAVSYAKNANSTTWFNYDDHGRVSWVVKSIANLGTKTIDYTYNAQDVVSEVDYQKGNIAESFSHYYNYDADGRLVNVQTSSGNNAKIQQANYYYYLHGPLKRVELGNYLQGIDYVYTSQGWLKSINSATGVPANDPSKDGVGNSFAPDVFGMQLEYFNGDYNRTTSNITSIVGVDAGSLGAVRFPLKANIAALSTQAPAPINPIIRPGSNAGTGYYNGVVSGISWQSQQSTGSTPSIAMYAYNYDSNYQLTNSVWGAPNFTAQSFTASNIFNETPSGYDFNGNILGLTRTDRSGNPDTRFGNYNYGINNNQLISVTGLKAQGYGAYTYNTIGQLQSATIQPPPSASNQTPANYYPQYDFNGKMIAIYADPGLTTLEVTYAYDESGNRISRTDYTGKTPVTTNFVYDTNNILMAIYNATTLSEVPVYGHERLGTYTPSNNNFVYELRDNVGNVRVVINGAKVNGNADVVSYDDYFPFGSVAQSSTNGNTYRYDYQGLYSQKDGVTGWNNFELRMYDANIGKWLTTDPQGQFDSPYEGMGNDPVTGTDATGGFTSQFWANANLIWQGLNGYGWDSEVRKATAGFKPQNGPYFIGTQTGTSDGVLYTRQFKSKYEFAIDGTADVDLDIGAAEKIKLSTNTYAKVEASLLRVNLINYDGNYNFKKLNGSLDYIGKNGALVSQKLDGEISLGSQETQFGGEIHQSFRTTFEEDAWDEEHGGSWSFFGAGRSSETGSGATDFKQSEAHASVGTNGENGITGLHVSWSGGFGLIGNINLSIGIRHVQQ